MHVCTNSCTVGLLSAVLEGEARFGDGQVVSTSSRPHQADARFQPWEFSYDRALSALHAQFIVTTADTTIEIHFSCHKGASLE